jgi:hypothetical protein
LHFTGVIECLILVDRLKNFSLFLKRVFTISPKKITLIIFFISLIIDFPPIFQYAGYEFDYYYYTTDGKVSVYKVYILIASALASSYIGSIIEVIVFTIRDGVTLIFSISLNIACYIQMKRQMAKKQTLTTAYLDTVMASSRVNDMKTERERKYQKNMSQLTITLVMISTIVRITTLTCGIYWLFSYDFIAVVLGVSADTAIALNATVPFFVYLRFNRKYRKIFLNLISGRNKNRRQVISQYNVR